MNNIQKVAPLFIVALLLGNLAKAATVAVDDLTMVDEKITMAASPEAQAYTGYGSYSHGGYSYGGYSYGGYSYGGVGNYHGSYSYGGPHGHGSFHSHDHYHNNQFHQHDHYHSHSHFGFNAAAGKVELLPEVKVNLK